MLKVMAKHEDKDNGNTLKYEVPHSTNHKATQNKNNGGTTALELPGVVKTIFHCRQTSPWVPIAMYFLDTKYIKRSVRIINP